MAYDPMEGFQIGQAIGKSRGSAYGKTAQYMSDLTKERDARSSKINPLELMIAKQSIQPNKKVFSFDPETGTMQEVDSLPGNSIVRNLKPTLQEHTDAAIEKKKLMGAGAQSGALNAAIQAKKSADNALSILFPDGTPKSFRRDVASTKNFIGRATLSKDAQNLKREYGIALDMFNKQVTGLAFSEQEYKNRVRQFEVDLLSNPEAAYESIKKLGDMSTDYLKIADPQGMYTGRFDQESSQQVSSNKPLDPRELYNQLREQGVPPDEAKRQAGL